MSSSTATVNTTSTVLEPLHVQEEGGAQNISSLPPTDRGKDALLFLASSFMIEALVWGFALSFGVMQEYYSTHPPFEGSGNIATVGTTASGLMYFGSPILCALITLRPSLRKWMIWSAPFIIAAALIGSSFATTVDQLILTQGVLYAIGGNIIYIPTICLLDEWFVQRKGLAYGIMWAGTGTAGVVMPLAMNAALERYGHEIVLRAAASMILVLMLPFLPFIKPRLPPSRTHRIDLGFIISPQFLVLQLANVIQALGFFLPSIYLPTYASELGAGPTVSALTLVVVNAATVAGSIITGGMSDTFHVTTVMGVIAVTSAVATFVFWGLSTNLGLLFAFCAVYGVTAGGFSSVWPGMLKVVQRSGGNGVARNLNVVLALGVLAAGRGFGNVISGPVSQKLIQAASAAHGPGYRGEYGPLIIFTGVTAICSGFAVLLRAKPGFL